MQLRGTHSLQSNLKGREEAIWHLMPTKNLYQFCIPILFTDPKRGEIALFMTFMEIRSKSRIKGFECDLGELPNMSSIQLRDTNKK